MKSVLSFVLALSLLSCGNPAPETATWSASVHEADDDDDGDPCAMPLRARLTRGRGLLWNVARIEVSLARPECGAEPREMELQFRTDPDPRRFFGPPFPFSAQIDVEEFDRQTPFRFRLKDATGAVGPWGYRVLRTRKQTEGLVCAGTVRGGNVTQSSHGHDGRIRSLPRRSVGIETLIPGRVAAFGLQVRGEGIATAVAPRVSGDGVGPEDILGVNLLGFDREVSPPSLVLINITAHIVRDGDRFWYDETTPQLPRLVGRRGAGHWSLLVATDSTRARLTNFAMDIETDCEE